MRNSVKVFQLIITILLFLMHTLLFLSGKTMLNSRKIESRFSTFALLAGVLHLLSKDDFTGSEASPGFAYSTRLIRLFARGEVKALTA